MENSIELTNDEQKLCNLIKKIIADVVTEQAGVTFAKNNEVLVTKEKLMSIMCCAGIACYEAGRSGEYVSPYPDIPSHLIN